MAGVAHRPALAAPAQDGLGEPGWGEPGSLDDGGTDFLLCPLQTALHMDEKEASVPWAPLNPSTQSRSPAVR